MHKSNIQGKAVFLEKQGKLGEQDRREIRSSLLDCFAGIVADENRVNPEMSFHFRGDIIR